MVQNNVVDNLQSLSLVNQPGGQNVDCPYSYSTYGQKWCINSKSDRFYRNWPLFIRIFPQEETKQNFVGRPAFLMWSFTSQVERLHGEGCLLIPVLLVFLSQAWFEKPLWMFLSEYIFWWVGLRGFLDNQNQHFPTLHACPAVACAPGHQEPNARHSHWGPPKSWFLPWWANWIFSSDHWA